MIDFNSFLFIGIALSLIGGIIFGLYSNRIFSLVSKLKKNENQLQNSKVKEGERKRITETALLKGNFQLLEDEIKIYKFEKDLVSRAIENILHASKNKTIDTFEKDRLLLKYNEQLKKLNDKMEKIQSEIDVTKLIDLRNDLASILDNKISYIDEKIKEINLKIETKSKILEAKNQNKKNNNTTNNNNLNNIYPSVDNGESVDVNLKSRKVINMKNNSTNKKKDAIIDAERKKIIDLKDQVLAALNRLDRAGIIKEEIENEVLVLQESQAKNFTQEDNKNSLQKVQNAYEFNYKGYPDQAENKIITQIKTNEKVPVPTIFSSLRRNQSKNDTITSKAILNPLLRNNNQGIRINNNDKINRIKIERSINEKEDIINYNNNKSTPISNILNYSNLKIDQSINSKDFDNDTVKAQNKDKQFLDNDKPKKFKFPLGIIFSRTNKEKNIKNRKYDHNTKRKDSLSNILN